LPMKIITIGLNHKTAPIAIREKLYLSPTEREYLLSELKCLPSVAEAMVISTCNRTEIYAHMLDDQPEILIEHMFRIKKMGSGHDARKHFYIYKEEKAVEHFFEVACGLNSLVLGEKQILGQVKEAVALSREKGMLSKTFNILSHVAIRAGKKAQHETEIGNGGSSVSWAAIAMAQKVLGTLEGKTFLIIGAGKMGKLATCYLHKKGWGKVYLMNRTEEKAASLAGQLGAEAVPFWRIKEILSLVDVCICASGAPHYLIDKDLVAEAARKREGRLIVFMDMSIPRNINPAVATVDHVKLFTIDDLEVVVKGSSERRQAAVREVQDIIVHKTKEFYGKLSACAAHGNSAVESGVYTV